MKTNDIFLFAVAIFSATRLRGGDWPQWRGPTRTGHVSVNTKVPITLPLEPKIIWRFKVGEGFASPVVAAGKVFYFDNQGGKETLHAINAADHQELWRASVDDVFHDE